MRAATKVKVDRLLLIEKLKKSRENTVTTYDRMLKKYETDHPKCADKVAAALRKAADKLQVDPEAMFDMVNYSRYSSSITLNIDKINMPEKPRQQETESLDKMINVLELSTEPTIMVSVGDDYYRYL